MTHTRLIRVATACTLGAAAAFVVAGSTAADPPPRHDFVVAAVAIPVTPGTNADDNAIRFETAHGRSDAKINGVATSSLGCGGCSAHAFTVQVVYAPRSREVTADNVATAWASQCAGCSGWAVSLQIVVARSAGAVTAANRALAFTTVCDHCTVNAVAVQIIVIAATDRQLTSDQMDSIQALYDRFTGALTPPAPSRTGVYATQATPSQAATTITATTNQIQAMVAASLHATSATHSVAVR